MERFDKFLEGHDQATEGLFYFGNFARQFELAPEALPEQAMQAAEQVMRFREIALALVAGMALVGCGPTAETPAAETASGETGVEMPVKEVGAGADAITPGNPFFGSWAMSSAKIAPWWDGEGDEPAADPAFAGNVILGANKSSGPALLNCDKPRYAVNVASPRGLFGGNLPDAAKDAAALGFASDEITTMTFTCADGLSDVSLNFPMIDDDTIMLGLDNVLYTLKRVRG